MLSSSDDGVCDTAEVCNCDGVPYWESEGKGNHELFLKFFMAYMGSCQVDAWTEAHGWAVDVGFWDLNWWDSTSVDGSLVNGGLILDVLIVVMVTDRIVREIPVCEGVFGWWPQVYWHVWCHRDQLLDPFLQLAVVVVLVGCQTYQYAHRHANRDTHWGAMNSC